MITELIAVAISLLPLSGIHYSAIKHGLRHGIDPALVLAVIQVESGGDPNAVKGDCLGLMQVSYKTWKRHFKLDRSRMFEVDYNISAGVRILRHYLDKEHGDLEMTLFRYNNGYKHHNHKYAPNVLRCYKNINFLVEMRKKYAIL